MPLCIESLEEAREFVRGLRLDALSAERLVQAAAELCRADRLKQRMKVGAEGELGDTMPPVDADEGDDDPGS